MLYVVLAIVVTLGGVACLIYLGMKKAQAETAWEKVGKEGGGGANYRSKLRGRGAKKTSEGTVEGASEKPVVEVHVRLESARGKWDDTNYYWIVFCKNHWFHFRQNLFFRHRIPLGETDEVAPPPELKGPFVARCDDCGKEYLYRASDLLKHEEELEKEFTPHPLFR